MKLNFKYVPLIMSIFLISCEEISEINYTDLKYEKKIVFQGFLTNKGIKAKIKKTLPPLYDPMNQPESYLDTIIAQVYENDIYVYNLIEKDSVFVSPENAIIKENHYYQIKVNSPGIGEAITAKIKLHNASYLDSIYTFEVINNNFRARFFNITITDPAKQNIDHEIEITHYYKNGIVYESNISSEKPLEFNPSGIYQFRLQVDLPRIFNEETNRYETIAYPFFDSIRCEIISCSPEFMKYKKDIYDQYDRNYNLYSEIRVHVFSNIQNGEGYFLSKYISDEMIPLSRIENK